MLCSRQFELFTELMEHQKTHVEKKYKCYVCNQACSSPHELSVHAKTHQFSCQICPKSFPSKQQLGHHMGLAHGSPVQVFQCSVCTFICTEKAVFYAHFNRDHRKIDCNFCPRKFQLQSRLDEHISKDHPEFDHCRHCRHGDRGASNGSSSSKTTCSGTCLDFYRFCASSRYIVRPTCRQHRLVNRVGAHTGHHWYRHHGRRQESYEQGKQTMSGL